MTSFFRGVSAGGTVFNIMAFFELCETVLRDFVTKILVAVGTKSALLAPFFWN